MYFVQFRSVPFGRHCGTSGQAVSPLGDTVAPRVKQCPLWETLRHLGSSSVPFGRHRGTSGQAVSPARGHCVL